MQAVSLPVSLLPGICSGRWVLTGSTSARCPTATHGYGAGAGSVNASQICRPCTIPVWLVTTRSIGRCKESRHLATVWHPDVATDAGNSMIITTCMCASAAGPGMATLAECIINWCRRAFKASTGQCSRVLPVVCSGGIGPVVVFGAGGVGVEHPFDRRAMRTLRDGRIGRVAVGTGHDHARGPAAGEGPCRESTVAG